MPESTKPWKPSHSDVVLRLRDNLGKLGIKVVDYTAEVRISIGQDLEGSIDLVTIGGYRTKGSKRGNALVLYEVKTESSRLFRVIFGALQQVSMYSLALRNPDLYVRREDEKAKLLNSLYYKKYLVIQRALWEEKEGLSDEEIEKLGELLASREVGIITYDEKWRFREDREYGYPKEQPTEYLGKPIRKKRMEKK